MHTKRKHFPCLEAPARCTMTSVSSKRYFSTDKRNNLSTVEERDDWCEWYLLPIDNLDAFYIQNIRSKYFLSISKDDGQLISDKDIRDAWILKNSPINSVQEEYRCRFVHEESGKCLGENIDTDSDTSLSCLPQECYDEKSEGKLNSIWALEIHTGELCFITSTGSNDLSINCDVFGKISPSKEKKGGGVWRFVETGGGFVKITSWNHNGKKLCHDEKGHIQTVDPQKSKNIQDKWKVQKAPSGLNGVIIQAVSSERYLQLKEGRLETTNLFEKSSCVWHLTSANQNKYFLYSTFLEKRLSTNKSDPFVNKPSSSDVPWTIKYVSENGSYEIYSQSHQKYLGSDLNGKVSVSPNSQDFEKWHLEELENGSFNVVSMKHGRFLACTKDGKLFTVTKIEESNEKSCQWYFDTAMPLALTGNQILIRSLLGASVIGMAAAAPFAVMGAIGFMGFTSGGITAGSFAAGMMSAEAIAAGGGVVAGGTVATLQSLGAVGLGLAGTSTAIGTGAVVGGAVYYGADKSMQKGKESPGQIALEYGSIVENQINNRPFCAWETW